MVNEILDPCVFKPDVEAAIGPVFPRGRSAFSALGRFRGRRAARSPRPASAAGSRFPPRSSARSRSRSGRLRTSAGGTTPAPALDVAMMAAQQHPRARRRLRTPRRPRVVACSRKAVGKRVARGRIRSAQNPRDQARHRIDHRHGGDLAPGQDIVADGHFIGDQLAAEAGRPRPRSGRTPGSVPAGAAISRASVWVNTRPWGVISTVRAAGSRSWAARMAAARGSGFITMPLPPP